MELNPEQFNVLIASINHLADALKSEPYTLTGASDWQMLMGMSGIGASMIGILFGIIVYNIKDLKTYIKESDSGVRTLLDKEEKERKYQDDLLWVKTREMITESQKEHSELKQDMLRCREKCCDGV